ncbi:MAG TPA: hypothetical protein PK997_02450 [Candidatus Omnitrophota bacterium]|jgi:hypothetical protein|nr:hypothetical protein [Candidatus Omnitrophota bacterium]
MDNHDCGNASSEAFSVSNGIKALGKVTGVCALMVLALLPAAVAADTVQAASGVPASDDYTTIQKDLTQDRLSDALRRIQMLEQENRFLAKRVELLERNVNDIKNDRY